MNNGQNNYTTQKGGKHIQVCINPNLGIKETGNLAFLIPKKEIKSPKQK